MRSRLIHAVAVRANVAERTDARALFDAARLVNAASPRRLRRDRRRLVYLLGPDASWVDGQVLRVNGGAA
ncbi:hypothetical protein [Nocardia sp. NBC_01388]|uniref:hypothetical protein n=1 Tax=Nocardia sp. NBC_01388 TaxID=2903596 RepID=UPI003253B8E5